MPDTMLVEDLASALDEGIADRYPSPAPVSSSGGAGDKLVSANIRKA